MKVNVLYSTTGELISLEIHEETTFEVLKSLIEIELNLDDFNNYELSIEGKILQDDGLALSNIVNEGSVFILSEKSNKNIVENANFPSNYQENLMHMLSTQLFTKIKEDQSLKSVYYSKSSEYRDAIDKDDIKKFTELIKNDYFSGSLSSMYSGSSSNLYNLDPLSPEYQRLIEEQVRKQNVEENLILAQDHLPESFAQVHMLYINVEVNGVSIKAFVDSGAQTTIMSKKCAEKCNLVRLIDYRFSGIAQGVGTSKIVGKIHVAQMKIGNSFFPFSITVLEESRVDFLFGLDLLKRYQCCIDLHQNALIIGDEKVKFLTESEIKSEISQIDSNDEYAQSFDEGKKLQLLSLGFSESQVINALKATNGNTELAASLLFSSETFE
ncbi:ubiquitin domain containing with a UBA domain at the C-terminus [Cryptosporidium sp. chipmunk genotype I]|uniref:ubiquitin domain containing with a UBA domain at the C-terminus n=1 Tax=Cryptosporidium sp. chipmunk genotype I TaxID=1280935 RepID=UPI00351AB022|nr:ubiquitin domain containing with a UBA domain at the C-terminus [Cryptosporidium sp. chipmunk genotype I]